MNDKEKVVARLVGIEKHLWCPLCKCFPDVIKEEYQDKIRKIRKWNGDEYELESSNIDEQVEFFVVCELCNTKLENIDGSNQNTNE